MSLPEHTISSNKYGQYCVPKSSIARPASQKILAGQVWEKDTVRLIVKNCRDGDIIHAGTFFGDFLPAFSSALQPGARLWAFEPSRENFLCAQKTVALNRLANVTLTNAGLGARQGTGSLCVATDGDVHGGASRFVEHTTARETYETVPIVALDDVVPQTRNVSILQLDVEGYEQQALEGALDLVRRCRPLLVLETLPRDLEWHKKNILSCGYREICKVHQNHVLATPDVALPVIQAFGDLENRKAERRAKRRETQTKPMDAPY